MRKALSRTLWGVAFVGGLTVLGAGAANAADTSGEDGIASGNQIGILSELPVTIGGNAISILGDSESSATSTESAASGDSTQSASTSGEDGIASGNQVMPDVALPVTVTGNSISVIGDSSAEGVHTGPPADESSGDTTPASTTGEDGIASGNQVMPDVDAPVFVGGNDVSIIRDETALGFGLVDNGIIGENTPLIGFVDERMLAAPDSGLVSGPVVDGSVIGEAVVSEPVVRGPLVRTMELAVLAPQVTDPAAGGDGAVSGDGQAGPTPLLATAALAPAMLLAATGVGALPLLGGIALMLGTGLALVVSTRMKQAIG
jgi:trimeric autotransporter adhesin